VVVRNLLGVLKPLTISKEQLNQHFLHAVMDWGWERKVRKKVKDIALLLLFFIFHWRQGTSVSSGPSISIFSMIPPEIVKHVACDYVCLYLVRAFRFSRIGA
jgi:hypothetical protein